MDFAVESWEVSSEANVLADNLFGQQKSEKQKKANNRKQNVPLQVGKKNLVEHQSDAEKDRKIKKNMKKSERVVSKVSGKTGDNAGNCEFKNPDKLSNTEKKNGKKRKVSAVSQELVSNEETISISPKKQKVILSTKDNSGSVSDADFNATTPSVKKNVSKHSVDVQSEKKKKKRKRKCKKNKFKDYSVEAPSSLNVEVSDVTTDIGKVNCSNPLGSDPFTVVNTDKKEKGTHEVPVTSDNPKSDTSNTKKKRKKKKNDLKNDSKDDSETNITKIKTVKDKHSVPFDRKKLAAVLDTKKTKDKLDNQHEMSPVNGDVQDSDFGTSSTAKFPSSMSLLQKSRERLNAARFRYLNEQLYTSTGKEAFQLFKKDREAFDVYHEGFQSQVEKWPTNPLDVIISHIRDRPKHLVVADFGCGDAKLAQSVPNKVHSFDLVALNDKVTVCEMSKVPLGNASVDVAIFCLSLMGTDLTSYLMEALRVLKNGGTLLIAEVSSRFNNVGQFMKQVEKLGFKLRHQDSSNKMFVLMDFKKTSQAKLAETEVITLKPCVYKKR